MDMRTEEMRSGDAKAAVQWLTRRMRKMTGNERLVFPENWMPNTGLTVLDAIGSPIAVAALYLEKSSPVAVCGWCVTNPEIRISDAGKAIRILMSALPVYARRHGAEYLLTTFGNRGINHILDEIGFIGGDSNVQHKFMKL